ncbi:MULTISPECIES: hypothetical protein [Neisseria]|uniref:Lipoprotein n=1 Tax=Neisseria musculi TaxID=1815583 RepID=A0A7H1M8A6_9NEIS|nr:MULTISPECIES: hypothetical protein [Neisseria]MBF0803017.1 hypothetical protein [Neisseria sp. 19428wB4_WF04]QNT57871.1 putative lipoprotein [Neisseria musculi]TFU44312.1 hypothetical protein E4T99_01320 [Neisseria sp. WF04]TFV06024.1 hypothetical protein E4T85_20115 [Bacillus stratosphericus]
MKKIIALPLALLLAACAADGNINSGLGMGNALVKAALDNQCRAELNKRNEWRLIALAMTAEKQQEWENKICGCASEEAPNQITANEMVQIVNPATRAQAAASVTAKTVTACVKRLYR